jgi:type VI protein secretion system component Hcp
MATITIKDLNSETTTNEALPLETIEAVKGGRSKQEVYLTYKLEDVIISSYS